MIYVMALRSASIDDLMWLNIADILVGFGVPQHSVLRGPAALLCRAPARRFAGQLAMLDAQVAAHGLQAGGAWIVDQLASGLDVHGPPPPTTGPLLVLANHPGLLDAAALFAALPRPDLRVLAFPRPFLRALPHIAAAVIPVGETPASRGAALRAAARHLREGGALLSFPAGRIEPDPLSLDGAESSLEQWSASIDLLGRLAGSATVLPAIVGGVIAPAALRHPVVRLRRAEADRRWLAAVWQLMRPALGRIAVHVRFGTPMQAATEGLSTRVTAEAARLITELRRP
jgi:1-acyl-sn-glycerol-3-phosphate acyltransferase